MSLTVKIISFFENENFLSFLSNFRYCEFFKTSIMSRAGQFPCHPCYRNPMKASLVLTSEFSCWLRWLRTSWCAHPPIVSHWHSQSCNFSNTLSRLAQNLFCWFTCVLLFGFRWVFSSFLFVCFVVLLLVFCFVFLSPKIAPSSPFFHSSRSELAGTTVWSNQLFPWK